MEAIPIEEPKLEVPGCEEEEEEAIRREDVENEEIDFKDFCGEDCDKKSKQIQMTLHSQLHVFDATFQTVVIWTETKKPPHGTPKYFILTFR